MKILIAESRDFAREARAILETIGEVVDADLDRRKLLTSVSGFDVLWVRLRNQIDAEVLRAAPNLRFIVTNTTGLNHIDLEAAESSGVRVISLRGETSFLQDIRATAELTVGLLLAVMRRLPPAIAHVRGGRWDRDPFRGHELYEKTAGVVGYGRLGRIVGDYLRHMGMQVLATDRAGVDRSVESTVKLVPLDVLLRESEVVTLHVNLTKETRGFFGQREFERMKDGAWFVNTARGELIDEYALLEALTSGRLSGAALDVLADEHARRREDHPLIRYAQSHDNLIITPHIGGNTVESWRKTEVFLANKLAQQVRL